MNKAIVCLALLASLAIWSAGVDVAAKPAAPSEPKRTLPSGIATRPAPILSPAASSEPDADQSRAIVVRTSFQTRAPGNNSKLSGTLPTGGNVVFAGVSPDGSTAVYVADQDADEVYELYSVPVDGLSSPTKINDTLTFGGSVLDFLISPDGTAVIYQANQDSLLSFELYTVPIGGPGSAAIKLNGTLAPGSFVGGFGLTPDGTRVAYLADQDTPGVFELYSAPADGSGSPVKLNGSPVTGGNVIFADFSPDSSTVFYLADQNVDETFDLFSVPADGSAAATRLNKPLPASGFVGLAAVSPDSTRVVYTADEDTAGQLELYSIPIGGPTGTGTKLNGTLVSGGNVTELTISPDGSRVAYRADQSTDEVFEVYSVPIDASTAATRLNDTLPSFSDVAEFVNVSPDSQSVAFRADLNVDEAFELYSVPIDGSAAPIVLQAASVPGNDVSFFTNIGTPVRGQRVIYPLLVTGAVELYSVPVDGSQPPVRLNDPLPPNAFVVSVLVPSGNPDLVIYSAQQDTFGVTELYTVPIMRTLAPEKVNGTLTAGGNVSLFTINSTETHALYLADQDTDEVVELYSTEMDTDSDGVLNTTDNCPLNSNPTQGPVVFGQQVVATNRTELGWTVTADVNWLRGPLGGLAAYTTDSSGSMADVIALSDGSQPAPGTGFYYLLQDSSCPVASWQSSDGAEPARDSTLP